MKGTRSRCAVLKAVILAGGYGRRLKPLTNNVPKPLIPVLGKPIIVWQIEWLKKSGIDEIIICTGYLKEELINSLGNGRKYGVKIGYVVEEEPLGTAGALKNAEVFLDESFYLINGDNLTNLELAPLSELSEPYIVSMALVPLRSPYGVVKLDGERVMSFQEKPLINKVWINAGVYFMKPDIFNYLPNRGDLETKVFPRLAREGRLKGVVYPNAYWRGIDTQKDLEEAERELKTLRNIF